MPEDLCLVDSNILIRWVQPHDPDFAVVESAVTSLAQSGVVLSYTSQNLGEFWNALTRPVARNGYGLSPEQADWRARSFESRLRLLPDSPAVYAEWRRLLVDNRGFRCSGARCSPCCSDARTWGAGDPDAQYEGFRAVHRDRSDPSPTSGETMRRQRDGLRHRLRG